MTSALFLAGLILAGIAWAQDIPAPAQPLPADAVRGEKAVPQSKVYVQDPKARTPVALPPSGEPRQPDRRDDGRNRPGHGESRPKKVYVPVAVPTARSASQPTPQASGDSIVITKDPATGDRIMMTRPVPIEQPRQDFPYGQVIVNPETGRKK